MFLLEIKTYNYEAEKKTPKNEVLKFGLVKQWHIGIGRKDNQDNIWEEPQIRLMTLIIEQAVGHVWNKEKLGEVLTDAADWTRKSNTEKLTPIGNSSVCMSSLNF